MHRPLFLLGFAPAIVSAISPPHVHLAELPEGLGATLVSAIEMWLHLPAATPTWFSFNWPGIFWTNAYRLPGASLPWIPIFQFIFATSWLLWLAGFLAAIVTPARGLHDRLAGTRLVPR